MSWLDRLNAFPVGAFELWYEGRRYAARKTIRAGGRSLAFYAEELGGKDFVSLNVYFTERGTKLRPCEMPEAKVTGFLASAKLL